MLESSYPLLYLCLTIYPSYTNGRYLSFLLSSSYCFTPPRCLNANARKKRSDCQMFDKQPQMHSLRPKIQGLISMAIGTSVVQSDLSFFFRSITHATMTFPSKHKVHPLERVYWNVPRMPSFQVVLCTARDIHKMEKKQGVDMTAEESENGDSGASKLNSETYSMDMTQAMGAVLTYRHELGMNYNFVLPDLIVGSCLQTPADVDRLKTIGVGTIFCLQQDPDLEYFGVDICAIQDHARMLEGIQHIRAPIRDFDPFDLRARLPVVIAKLHKAVTSNGGITYVHCTAGLGRAPAVALTYMYWILGYSLDEANTILQGVRPCFPKLDSIRHATCDILTGGATESVLLQWKRGNCHSVEISGLDVGWGPQVPLTYNPRNRCWTLMRELPVGKFEYKYIVDGIWTCNPDEPVTQPNKDGHVNNYVEVVGSIADDETRMLRLRLTREDGQLSEKERKLITENLKVLDED